METNNGPSDALKGHADEDTEATVPHLLECVFMSRMLFNVCNKSVAVSCAVIWSESELLSDKAMEEEIVL